MSVAPKISADGLRHSRLGIASVVIGGGLPLLLIVLLVAGAAFSASKFTIGNYLLIAFAIVGASGPLIHVVGLALGAAGLFSKTTKRVFPVTGVVLNLLLGISGVLLIVLFLSNLKFGFH